MTLSCFKAYDVRGKLGRDLDANVLRAIGQGLVAARGARSVVVGRDVRASSERLAAALIDGLTSAGADVRDIGLCGTEEVYFATDHYGADAGLCVTASHNPIDYNGVKLVGAGARPLSPADLDAVREAAEAALAGFAPSPAPGDVTPADPRDAYVERVVSFVEPGALGPLKVLVNAGNGAAGPTFDRIAAALAKAGARVEWVRLHHAPDPSFPNGIPNPLLPENQPVTGDAVVAQGCDLGLAWDGDFDRCFFFDHEGRFVPGEYVVALLAGAFLARAPGATIVHEPRVEWATRAAIAAAGGRAVRARSGHAFMKAAMRDADAVYGGEMSAHHYFRRFMSCDSGMIPALLVLAHLSATGRGLADLVGEMRAAFPSSGEINFRVADAEAAIARVEARFGAEACARDDLDGMSLEFADWRLNLRRSNTEPLLRLNVETRGDAGLLAARVAELTALIEGME
ncbi:phosphomannomutase [Roseobacter sp. HKCCA0434]|uniref:phosphomannomutase n=1 Tax=Roseobacter sp. HKCCA0434 TaxID=3079297 RepID=UPI002905DEAC|nr:phosphomannomutase [Roseobacter sp. HKCCA0434]